MNTILEFLQKWGMLILVLLGMTIMFNTCGLSSGIKGTKKEVAALKQELHLKDSLNREITSIEREISILETANEVVYTNNAIVRTAERPDDVMQKYAAKIKELKQKLEKVKNAGK